MRIRLGRFLSPFFIFAFGCAGAAAYAAPALAASAAVPPKAMRALGQTTQPIGHYDFCRRYPGQCRAHNGAAAPLRLTPQTMRLLRRVNAAVNKKVRAATDWEIYGQEEYWEYPDKSGHGLRGDCEDYALMKQRELQKYGLPAGDLLITVARKPDGEAHAVLTARTTGGDFILDNLRAAVLNWQDTDYRYIKRQSVAHAGLWVALEPRQNAPLLAGTAAAGVAATRAIAAGR